jgi:hypothetical protein
VKFAWKAVLAPEPCRSGDGALRASPLRDVGIFDRDVAARIDEGKAGLRDCRQLSRRWQESGKAVGDKSSPAISWK